MKTIKVKELEVPAEIMAAVAEILGKEGISNSINGGDDEQNIITLEVHYGSDEEDKRNTVREIEAMITNYEEQEEEDDDK